MTRFGGGLRSPIASLIVLLPSTADKVMFRYCLFVCLFIYLYVCMLAVKITQKVVDKRVQQILKIDKRCGHMCQCKN